MNAPNETIDKDIEDLLDFEIKLANISGPYEKTGGAAYQRFPLKKLAKLVTNINWKKYFEFAIPVGINETEQIGVYGLDYFMDIQDLVSITPER